MSDKEQHNSNSDTKDYSISQFWSWFETYQQNIRQSSSLSSQASLDLTTRLHAINRDLTFEVCLNADPRELIISAEGHAELFPLIDTMVSAAPIIEGWSIIALKPPMGFGFKTTYRGITYDPRLMWFMPMQSQKHPSAIGLKVAVLNYDPPQASEILEAVMIILRTALGERSASTDIQHVEISELPENPSSQGFIELNELADYIAWKEKDRSVRNR